MTEVRRKTGDNKRNYEWEEKESRIKSKKWSRRYEWQNPIEREGVRGEGKKDYLPYVFATGILIGPICTPFGVYKETIVLYCIFSTVL